MINKKTTTVKELKVIFKKSFLEVVTNQVKENKTGELISNIYLISKKRKKMLIVSKATAFWRDSETQKEYKFKLERDKKTLFFYKFAIRYSQLKPKEKKEDMKQQKLLLKESK